MVKVRFTKEHYIKLLDLASRALMDNAVISTKMGQPLNIVELLHTTTIGTLNDIRLALSKQIDKLESQDEWAAAESTQSTLESLKERKELVNLIIGYKRFKLEAEETQRKKAELTAQLDKLKESQKTPEERIKELEAKLADLDSDEF